MAVVSKSPVRKLVRLARLRHYEKLKRVNETSCERSSKLPAKEKCMPLQRPSETKIGRSFRIYANWGNQKQEIIDETVGAKLDRLSQKRKNQQPSRGCKLAKYDRQILVHQVIESYHSDGSVKELSFYNLKSELETFYGSCSGNNAASIKRFLSDVKEGPYYICTCCNRML